jgi:2-phosphosulfolactate phosphatase
MIFDQAEYDIRCEWGEHGIATLAPISDAIVIVDVLSFSTCVAIAVARGATVFPYRWRDESRIEFARSVRAELAGPRGGGGYSLSPASLMSIPAGARIVLPSPNGSSLTLATGRTSTLAGCLRNAGAVARAAMQCGRTVGVVPAGERWKADHSLRPAIEDLIGAGAVISHLAGTLSPEAQLAMEAFRSVQGGLADALMGCSSGKELIAAGYTDDVRLAAEVHADDCAPYFRGGAYQQTGRTPLREGADLGNSD